MPRIAAALTSVLAVVALTVLGAPAASAAPDVTEAAAALRSGDPVYSAPDAENALSGAEVDALANQVLASEVPMFVAVLPAAAAGGGTADETLTALKDEVGLAGVYAVIVGDQFRAGSTADSVADLATQAFRAQGDAGAAAVLSEFVALTDQRFSSNPAADSAGSSDSGGGGSGVLIVLLVLFIGGAVVVVVMSRRAKKTRELQLAAVRRTVDEDITEYGERLGSFSLADPDFDDATRADMQRALDSYDRAKSSVALMRSPADAANVTTALEDGRYALACVDARLARQPLPERRPPCFVDPRHGPSVADVVWAPPGLGERDVPMCAACRTTVETGGQPHSLEVATAGGSRPYYQAGPEYGAYAQGYYSPFAGVMTAVVMGTMLSSMWHVPGVTSAAGMDSAGFGGGGGDSSGFGGFGGGSDFDGGGFGGGDFGGGDF
jgi:hypothetical protein